MNILTFMSQNAGRGNRPLPVGRSAAAPGRNNGAAERRERPLRYAFERFKEPGSE